MASIVTIRGALDSGILKSSIFFTSRVVTDAEDGLPMEQRKISSVIERKMSACAWFSETLLKKCY